jgi:hypothetical protein
MTDSDGKQRGRTPQEQANLDKERERSLREAEQRERDVLAAMARQGRAEPPLRAPGPTQAEPWDPFSYHDRPSIAEPLPRIPGSERWVLVAREPTKPIPRPPPGAMTIEEGCAALGVPADMVAVRALATFTTESPDLYCPTMVARLTWFRAEYIQRIVADPTVLAACRRHIIDVRDGNVDERLFEPPPIPPPPPEPQQKNLKPLDPVIGTDAVPPPPPLTQAIVEVPNGASESAATSQPAEPPPHAESPAEQTAMLGEPPSAIPNPALDYLRRALVVPFDGPGAGEPLPVIVARACRPLRPGDDKGNAKIESALEMLLAIGMKPAGRPPAYLFIATNHPGLQRALEGTPFHGQNGRRWRFAEMLGRVEGVRRNEQQWFAGESCKGLLVPLMLLPAPPASSEEEQ